MTGETIGPSRFTEMVRNVGKDLVPLETISEVSLLTIAEQLYIATNNTLELEKVPESLRSHRSLDDLARCRGQVAALNGVLIILGQEGFVVANEERAERIKRERGSRRGKLPQAGSEAQWVETVG